MHAAERSHLAAASEQGIHQMGADEATGPQHGDSLTGSDHHNLHPHLLK